MQNIGHARKGVGATIGEEMEQVNATISRYGNKVKHMTKESNFHEFCIQYSTRYIAYFLYLDRNDTLTAGLLYMNRERILRMPKFLAKRYSRVRDNLFYKFSFQILCFFVIFSRLGYSLAPLNPN